MSKFYKFEAGKDYFCKVCKETKSGVEFGNQRGIYKNGVERFKCKQCWEEGRVMTKDEHYRPKWIAFLETVKDEVAKWESAGSHLEGDDRWLPVWSEERGGFDARKISGKTLVDKEVYEALKHHYITKVKEYAVVAASKYNKSLGVIKFPEGKTRQLRLHEIVLGEWQDGGIQPYATTVYEVVDHNNGDPLDNRSYNLSKVSNKKNAANRTACMNSTGFTGVYWKENKGYYISYVCSEGKNYQIGTCKAREDLVHLVKARDASKLMICGTGSNNKVLSNQEIQRFISLHLRGISPEAAVVYAAEVYGIKRRYLKEDKYRDFYNQAVSAGILDGVNLCG